MEKKYLFIGGYFDKREEEQIVKDTIGAVQYAANEFQRKLINGFLFNLDNKYEFDKISVPFIGTYPNNYKKIYFKSKNNNREFISFFNLFAVRNLSRKKSLINSLKKKNIFNNTDLTIFVYSLHTPLIDAAIYLKRKNKNVHICVIVPDLPQYMDLSNSRRPIYKFFKKIDSILLDRKIKFIDSFVFLTQYMREEIEVKNSNYIIVEGIVDNQTNPIKMNEKLKTICGDEEYILYTGTLNERYGILDLINAFNEIDSGTVKLVIAGKGDSEILIREQSNKNIIYLGQISNEEAKQLQENSLCLVNPRKNDEVFTRYSFPSKNLEYLNAGRPVICYKLDGISDEYDNVFCYVQHSLSIKLQEVIDMDRKELDSIGKHGLEFVRDKKSANYQTEKILKMVERSQ